MTVMSSARLWSWLLAGALALVAALTPSLAGAFRSADNPDARMVLTRAELMSPISPSGPVDDGAFAMPADAGEIRWLSLD